MSRRLLISSLLALAAAMSPGATQADHSAPAADAALFQRAISAAQPYLVQIETVGGVQPPSPALARRQGENDPAPEQFRENLGSGFLLADGPTTGVIYRADGFILTSSFNFVREPSVVTVKLPDGRRLPARIVARDHVRKLAMLKVDASELPTPTWTPQTQARPGQWALAIGRGLGGDDPTVSVGIVSAVNRMMGNAIQTDAKLSPVNYGGPLLDSAGRLLGICVPMAQQPGELAGIDLYDAGVGFAIPGWRVHAIAEQLIQGVSVHRGWLGMVVDPHNEHGVQIAQTADPSPLRSAGAEPGDLITHINDQPIRHYGQLVKALYMIPAGEDVQVRLLRGAETLALTVTLARNTELGPLPEVEQPFDPSQPVTEPTPAPSPPDDE